LRRNERDEERHGSGITSIYPGKNHFNFIWIRCVW
jgi:hypothetical protein